MVAADATLLAAAYGTGVLWLAVPLTAAVLLAYRVPLAGFAAALALAATTGMAYALLIWSSYRAGRATESRRGMLGLAAVAAGGTAAQVVLWRPDPSAVVVVVSSIVFVALPVLAGRYVGQQEQLMSALAAQTRLAERLRIARDMHDSLGHRLSLISIEAAALEVGGLPAPEQEAVRRLASCAREAMTEVYGVVGALRDPYEAAAIGALVKRFRAAGVRVTVRGDAVVPGLGSAAGQAAYRVVEEGLTNAAKHASGQPVTVSVEPQDDTLLVTVVNPLRTDQAHPGRAGAGPVRAEPAGSELVGAEPAGAASTAAGGGSGLGGLAERVRLAGGLLHHQRSGGEFRLVAMLPAVPDPAGSNPAPASLPASSLYAPLPASFLGGRTTAVGIAVAALLFVVLPASLMMGAA